MEKILENIVFWKLPFSGRLGKNSGFLWKNDGWSWGKGEKWGF